MDTFLGSAARNIYNSHFQTDLHRVQVVLPNKRAGFYFKDQLSLQSALPFFSPEVTSIDDFIWNNTGLTKLDNLELYFRTFYIWEKYDANQSFEKFLTWVPTLFKDFNLIDSSLLANPQLLYKYMSEAEAIKRWEIGEELAISDSTTEYFTFFDRMGIVYGDLKTTLLEENMAYQGLAYRYLAENKDRLDSLPHSHIYFVGLNALSKAEESIIEYLVKTGKATCIWDSDDFYMENKREKAGKKLRLYKSSGKYGTWNFQNNFLLSSTKEINVFEPANKVLQAKLAADLLEKSHLQNHALVILDQDDFLPLYIQLPALTRKVNISAGYSLSATYIKAFLDILVQFIDVSSPREQKKLIKKVLSQKAFQDLSLTHSYKPMEETLPESLAWLLTEKSPKKFTANLLTVLEHYSNLETPEQAFALLIKERLGLLHRYVSQSLSNVSYKWLLNEVLKNSNVPFEANSPAKIQVMSMLETRCLDFEEVTFISFIEGKIPASQKNSSFLPFDAAKYFGLPLYPDQDAIMAYHFFRLLQRAKKVNIVFPKAAGGEVGKAEKSSFLTQIEEELSPLNPKINLIYKEISIPDPGAQKNGIEIQKSAAVLEKAKTFLQQNGLSPTSINDYLRSPIEFYWKYLGKMRNKNKDLPYIGADVFGSLIHYVLEKTDIRFMDELITKDSLFAQKSYALENFDNWVSKNQPETDFSHGLNLVLKNVAKELVSQYYNKRIREFRSPFRILAIEREFTKSLDIAGTTVRVKGKIDKIEAHGDTLYIVDYKTGKVEPSEITYPPFRKEIGLDEVLLLENRDKFRQLLVYFFLTDKEFPEYKNFEFKFYSFRNLEADLTMQIENYSNPQILVEVENMIKNIATDLVNPNSPFSSENQRKLYPFSDYADLLS